ncbi:FKBP-type peptidyl-prolyl cis-trans isomerase [Polynucleobacter sp. SHI8]|uniref:FKBP-type peptidyl-prolyl cis-trans isomerase n=1 Tax=unclassified Polynucleobacter TaxID=2640945 RepID=UPI00248FA77D|nr:MULTISPECIES: peptidylprolyl isomerase [unclassified Polynucleobacter]BDW11533.1 FKBP-type peptidyl-prolyl cis-trans isomerase [Polynucleobacter sp. SHI2]BDW13980.1 FKBP-type peptidyl-prolyl cis-trans isomerase [Polynucleobacter sp. SHI8]
MKIEKNTVVSLIYRLSDAQGNLIEESADPMIYLHGGYAGTFPKIEELLEDQEVGFETNIQLEPHDAFGDYDAELLRIEQRNRFPEPLEIGMQFEGVPSLDDEEDGAEFIAADDEDEQTLIYTVTDLAEDRVILDANHPLAGMALRFWIQVTEVRLATSEEVENGRAQDAMGLMIGDQDDDTDYDNLDDLISNGPDNHPTLH